MIVKNEKVIIMIKLFKSTVLFRYFSLLTLLLLIIFINISCNNNKSDKTIKFWHFWSEPNQRAVMNDLISKFEKENDCKVEVVELSWNDGKTKLFAAFNSKTAPDVLELGSDWIAQFSSAGVLAELNQDSMNLNNFIEFSLEPSIWNSKYYAVPFIVDTRVLFYNKDLMQAAGLNETPPETFSQLLDYSEKISFLEGKYGWGANTSDPHRLYKKIIPFFWSYGGEIFDGYGHPIIQSNENINALNMYLSLARTGYIETQKLIDAAFTEGKIGFWFSGGWLADKIKKENPKLNYGVSVFPGKDSAKGVSFAGGEYLAMSKQSTKRELSLKLIKYLTNGKNSIEFCKKITEAGFPADKNFYNDASLTSNPIKALFAKQLINSRMTPVHPKWLEIEAIIENATVEAMYGRKSSSMALSDAQIEIINLLNKK